MLNFGAAGTWWMRDGPADEVLSDRIDKVGELAIQTRGTANERAVDEWVRLVRDSCQQDAAHSMAAVGMIAPFIESVFGYAFPEIFPEKEIKSA